MILSKRWIPRELGLILVLLFVLLSPQIASAKSFDWPKDNLAKYPLLTIFGPDQKDSFAYVRGVEAPLKSNPDRKKFNFITLAREWTSHRKCSFYSRPPGLIHTTSLITAKDEKVRIAVPVSFKFSGAFSKERIKQILMWPILKVSLVKWTKAEKFTPLLAQKFLVRDFQNDNLIPEHSIKINYSNVLVSEPIDVPKGTDIRIRVQWSAETVCDESEFRLKIGDQIRLIRSN